MFNYLCEKSIYRQIYVSIRTNTHFTLCGLVVDCAVNNNQTQMTMNRSEFEVLELQVQQSDLPLKLYLYQAGVSYSTYHYRRKECPAGKGCARRALTPISFN